MQKLRLQKTKTFDNFIKDKLSKKSPNYQSDVLRTLRRLDAYTISKHGRTRDDIISYLREIKDIEEKEEECIGWVQGFIDNIADEGNLNNSALQVYCSHIKKFLKYYKIRIDFADEIELPPALLEERYALPIEQIAIIIENAPWKYKGYFLSLVSSGARPIEIMSLRKKDFTWTGKKWRALIPAKYTKKNMSRTVFFSIEVNQYLNQIFKSIDNEGRVWTKKSDLPDEKLVYARSNAGVMFRKICNKLGFTERYESTKFFKHNMYCFRSHFFTKALRSLLEDKDTAHAMIGHGAYLQSYQRRTDEEKLELFDEIEPSILVFDQTKNKEKIRKLTEANQKVNELEEKVEAMQKRSNMPTMKIENLSETIKKILRENPELLKT